MLHIIKHSESAEDAVHILQDRAESFDEDGARENDVISLKRSDVTDADLESGDDIMEDTESDYSNIEEITADSIEVKTNCSCKKKGVNYYVHKLKVCSRSKPCTICLYLFLILMIMASVVSLIVIGVLILAPFRKAIQYESIHCTAIRNTDQMIERRCSCGKGCSSTYPCVLVKVRLHGLPQHNDNNNNQSDISSRPLQPPAPAPPSSSSASSSSSPSILFENESMLMRKCSYYPPCKSSRIANEKAVHDYELKFGTPGRTFPCLYNPHNPKEVIRTRRFHLSHVIHGMVWSSLVFLISLGILIFAVKKKGCDFV